MVHILAALLALPSSAAIKESPALAQLRGAAAASERAAYAPSLEGAASGNQVWSENAAERPALNAGASFAAPAESAAAPAPSAPRFNLAADIPVPAAEPADPVPPKVKGWEGFKQGFLGTEALGLRLLSKTGKLAVPLLIILQPIVAPLALIAGLLGVFGIRL